MRRSPQSLRKGETHAALAAGFRIGSATAWRYVIWAIDLKRGMELGPWAQCIDRLATTPIEAQALLADAVAILEARAAFLA